MKCRHCGEALRQQLADLGLAPISNHYPLHPEAREDQVVFPLMVYVCEVCWLAQTKVLIPAEIMFAADYPYFSSMSASWMKHSKDFAQSMKMHLALSSSSLVVEIGSNDGYLLRNFQEMEIPCVGVEPALSTALISKNLGIPTKNSFFGRNVAEEIVEEYGLANLIIANNVLAHVPDINDFVAGMVTGLHPDGVISIEFPHLLQLIRGLQFDTIYHEHYSYFSLIAVSNILAHFRLRVFDVEKFSTHGGSLRVRACHLGSDHQTQPSVRGILQEEEDANLNSAIGYSKFQSQIDKVKDDFNTFLRSLKIRGGKLHAYGAAAKGVTFLNFCGVTSEDIEYVFDLAPLKQNHHLPVSNIPIHSPDEIPRLKPSHLLILPWNIKEEVIHQQSQVRAWGGKFITAVPKVELW